MPWDTVEEAEKSVKGLSKYSAKAKRAFLSAFNACYKGKGDSGSCYAIAHASAKKVDKKASQDRLDRIAAAVVEEYEAKTVDELEAAVTVEEIKGRQLQVVDIINKAGKEVQALRMEIDQMEYKLFLLVNDKPELAPLIAAAMAKAKLDTTSLMSKLVKAVETYSKVKVYPPRWVYPKSSFDLA